MVFDLRLLALTFGLRLAATTLVAELTDTDVRTSAVNGAANVVVLALRGTRVADTPLAVEVDHARAAVLAPLHGRDDGLLAVHLGLADEDETAGTEVAGVANATDFVFVLLGGPAENELDATDVNVLRYGDPTLGLVLRFPARSGVEIDGAELVVVAISPSPAVGQLVFGLEHCGDGSDDLFLVCLDWNERQRCQLFVADDFHRAIPPFKVLFCRNARGSGYRIHMIPAMFKSSIFHPISQKTVFFRPLNKESILKNFSFLLLTESGISFCPENSVQFSRRAKRGEPQKLDISYLVPRVGVEPT
ncbi:MAG: hypothetical protein CEN87_358 [Parcubacteria group bacterium Licking1014_1]|nr:MAG: hypothetical protein CEN87_358 [Parcubacteria group bacterium Licking1014_1]